MSKIFVTGGSGFLGRAFLSAALGRDDGSVEYVFAARDPSKAFQKDSLPSRSVVVQLDLHKGIELKDPVDVVVHIAAEKTDASKMRDVNVEGVRRLLEWSAEHGVGRFVHISSVGSYGAPLNSGSVREDAGHHPQNEYERTKSESEALVRGFCESHRIGWCILQPSNVFGWTHSPRKPLLSFVKSIASGRFRLIGSGEGTLNYIAVEDVAWAIWHAAHRELDSGSYILNDPCTVTKSFEAISEGLGMPPVAKRMPYPLAWCIATAFGLAKSAGLRPPAFDRQRLAELTNSTRYESGKILKAIGEPWPKGSLNGLRQLAARYRTENLACPRVS